MKFFLVTCFIVLTLSINALAKLIPIPLDESIKRSDLIVIGTLTNISEKSENFATYGNGTIIVEEFIAGNVKRENDFSIKSGDKLTLNYVEDFACVMGSHKRIADRKGVFLLKLNDDGEIESQDFRPLEDLTEIKKLLKKGIQLNYLAKKVKTLNDTQQFSQTNLSDEGAEDNVKNIYSTENTHQKYSPLSAFLIILASITLYYLLYRSRFKIR